jgi:hypothetical protein
MLKIWYLWAKCSQTLLVIFVHFWNPVWKEFISYIIVVMKLEIFTKMEIVLKGDMKRHLWLKSFKSTKNRDLESCKDLE